MVDPFTEIIQNQIKKILAKEPLAVPLTLDEIDEDVRSSVWPFDGNWNQLDMQTYADNPLFLFPPYFSVIKAEPQSYIVAAPSPLQVKFVITQVCYKLGIPCDQTRLDTAWIRPLNMETLAEAIRNFNKV